MPFRSQSAAPPSGPQKARILEGVQELLNRCRATVRQISFDSAGDLHVDVEVPASSQGSFVLAACLNAIPGGVPAVPPVASFRLNPVDAIKLLDVAARVDNNTPVYVPKRVKPGRNVRDGFEYGDPSFEFQDAWLQQEAVIYVAEGESGWRLAFEEICARVHLVTDEFRAALLWRDTCLDQYELNGAAGIPEVEELLESELLVLGQLQALVDTGYALCPTPAVH